MTTVTMTTVTVTTVVMIRTDANCTHASMHVRLDTMYTRPNNG